jgi:K+-transporting ATPase ATPase C chain
MMKDLLRGFLMLLVMTVLTGIVYPLVMTGLAQAIFPARANGSLVRLEGRVVGSEQIGQHFTAARYFHGRPSAAGEQGYDALASGGSNLGPTSRVLVTAVSLRATEVRAENGLAPSDPVPSDLVTASASGLDPDLTPAGAEAQVKRVAAARGWNEAEIRRLVAQETRPRLLGIWGEPRVNVLRLNLALDKDD